MTATTMVAAGDSFPALGTRFPVPFQVVRVNPVKPELTIREWFGDQEFTRVVKLSMLAHYLRVTLARTRRTATGWRPTLAVLPPLPVSPEAEVLAALAVEVEAKATLEAAKFMWTCACGVEFWCDAAPRMTPSCPECGGSETVNQFEALVNRLD